MTVLSWKSVLYQLLLAGGGIAIFTVGAFVKNKPRPLLFSLAIGTVLSAAVAAVLIDGGRMPFLQMLDIGAYARFFNVVFALVAFLSLLFSHQHAGLRQVAGDEFYGLMILAVLGMSLVAGATHWLVFFLGFELLSLAFYILIAMRRDDPAGNEASLKYLIMGMVSGGFLAFGIAMFYASTGTLDMPIGLANLKNVGSPTGMLLSLGLILTAAGFKISLVPFHLWTPDVYQGAPTPITAFLTTGSKIAVFAGLLRILMLSSNWLWVRSIPVLWTLAAATLLIGSITALVQTRIKRLLAYSSVSQMGYAAMGALAIREDGGLAVIFYFIAYVLMDLGAFGAIATLCASPESDLDELSSYRGIGYSHPWQAALLIHQPAFPGRPPPDSRVYRQIHGVQGCPSVRIFGAGSDWYRIGHPVRLCLPEGDRRHVHEAENRPGPDHQRLWHCRTHCFCPDSMRRAVGRLVSRSPAVPDLPGHHHIRCIIWNSKRGNGADLFLTRKNTSVCRPYAPVIIQCLLRKTGTSGIQIMDGMIHGTPYRGKIRKGIVDGVNIPVFFQQKKGFPEIQIKDPADLKQFEIIQCLDIIDRCESMIQNGADNRLGTFRRIRQAQFNGLIGTDIFFPVIIGHHPPDIQLVRIPDQFHE